jgi:hypothetical protein
MKFSSLWKKGNLMTIGISSISGSPRIAFSRYPIPARYSQVAVFTVSRRYPDMPSVIGKKVLDLYDCTLISIRRSMENYLLGKFGPNGSLDNAGYTYIQAFDLVSGRVLVNMSVKY